MTSSRVRWVYRGRNGHDVTISVEGTCREVPLPHVVYHSPTGFSWGYGGSGPSDLALSILAHHLGVSPTDANPNGARWFEYHDQHPARIAFRLHHAFKAAMIAPLPMGEAWEITTADIERWFEERAAG